MCVRIKVDTKSAHHDGWCIVSGSGNGYNRIYGRVTARFQIKKGGMFLADRENPAYAVRAASGERV